jgi:hypothetical protein
MSSYAQTLCKHFGTFPDSSSTAPAQKPKRPAWNRPPVNIEYSLLDANFPALPTNKTDETKSTAPSTKFTVSEDYKSVIEIEMALYKSKAAQARSDLTDMKAEITNLVNQTIRQSLKGIIQEVHNQLASTFLTVTEYLKDMTDCHDQFKKQTELITALSQFRDIRSGRPKLIRKYITEFGHLLSKSNIPAQVASLQDHHDIHHAKTLDNKITAGMKLAGRKCKTAKRLPHSGKLLEAQTLLRIYQKLLTQIRTQRNMSAQMLKQHAQLAISIPLPTTLANTNAKLRAFKKEVRKLSGKAYDLRNKQKKELADAIATTEGTSREKTLQHVQRAQHTEEMFAQLPGISMIKVPVNKPSHPEEALVWKTITNATEVETAILNKQKLHFNQAKDTPFAREPLESIFNWSGTSPQAERVLS